MFKLTKLDSKGFKIWVYVYKTPAQQGQSKGRLSLGWPSLHLSWILGWGFYITLSAQILERQGVPTNRLVSEGSRPTGCIRPTKVSWAQNHKSDGLEMSTVQIVCLLTDFVWSQIHSLRERCKSLPGQTQVISFFIGKFKSFYIRLSTKYSSSKSHGFYFLFKLIVNRVTKSIYLYSNSELDSCKAAVNWFIDLS